MRCARVEYSLLFVLRKPIRRYLERELRHEKHDGDEYQKIYGKDVETDDVAEQAEQRRYERGADVGARHLYADDRSRVFRRRSYSAWRE